MRRASNRRPSTAGPGRRRPPGRKLHAPHGAKELFRRVVGAWGNDDLIENAFDIQEFEPESVLEIGSMRFRFKHVPHFTETFAIDIASTNGGGRITYGADCSPNEALVEFARGTDLLIVEATLPRPERTGVRGHLTPAGGGRARLQGEREAGAAHPCIRRARRAVGAQLRQAGLRGAHLGRPRGRRIRSVTAVGGHEAGPP